MQHNSASMSVADGQVNDLGPLAWVFDELRKSLDAAGKALRRFAAEVAEVRNSDISAADPSALRVARSQLHQVVGALEMVGFQPAALVVRGMENAVQRFLSRPLTCTEVSVAKVERAGFALVEYLEATLNGKAISAVALFPQYRDVQELAAAQRVHPADLWDGHMGGRSFGLPDDVTVQAMGPGPAVRTQFDRYVLHVIKSLHPKAAAQLKQVSAGLAVGATSTGLRSFWVVAAAYFEAIQHGLLPTDVYVKRAASRVLLQYTAQAQGKQDVSSTLMHDLAFFVALVPEQDDSSTPWIRAVRHQMAAAATPPSGYDKATLGRYDPAVLTQARKRIGAAKEGWSLLAGGDVDKARQVADQFALVIDSLQKVLPQSDALGRALAHAIDQSRIAGTAPAPELAMEVATAILYLEALLQDLDSANGDLPDRLAELARRVENAVLGLPSLPLEVWMEDLYRRVSDKQTMGSVVGELKVNLTELERELDQFSRQPDNKSALMQVPQQLAQMRGVLSVLGLDQAAAAAAHMRTNVEDMLADEIDAERAREAGTFSRLANNLSALSFLIDMLNYQPTLAKKLFLFDADAGELRPVMGRTSTSSATVAAHPADAEGLPLADEVAQVVDAISAPGDTVDLAALTQKLGDIADQASLADNQPLAQAARQAVSAVATAPEEGAAALAELAQLAVPAAPLVEAMPAAEEDMVEDDLLDIFLEEARDVIQAGQGALSELAHHPDSVPDQTTLRRAFHTLKGSSRMVGLSEFGGAAWAMEQVMNAWLASFKPVTPDLSGLCADALSCMAAWVQDIAAHRGGGWQAQPFQDASEAMRNQGVRKPLPMPVASDAELAEHVDADAALVVPPIDVVDQLPFADTQTLEEPTAEADASGVSTSERTEDLLQIDFDALMKLADEVPAVAEAPEVNPPSEPQPVAEAEATFDWALPDEAEVLSVTAESIALEDSPDALAFDLIGEPEAACLPGEQSAVEPDMRVELDFGGQVEPDLLPEDVAEAFFPDLPADEPQPPVTEAEPAAVADDVKVIGDLTIGAKLFNVFLTEADEWSRRLSHDLGEWLPVHATQALPHGISAMAHSLAGASGAIGFTSLSELARALEHALDTATAHAEVGMPPTAADAQLFAQAADDLRRLLHQFAAGFLKEPAPGLVDGLQAYVHQAVATTPDAESDIVLEDISADEEDWLPEVTEHLPEEEAFSSHPLSPEPVEAAQEPVVPPAPTAQADVVPAAVRTVLSVDDDIDVDDALDADLFQIFDEEAQELLPRLGAALRQWAAQPASVAARAEALRTLHTLKGSARLAGALRLGEMAHRMETQAERIDPEQPHQTAALEALLTSYDALVARHEELRLPDTVAVAHRVTSAVEALPVPEVHDAPAVALVQPMAGAEHVASAVVPATLRTNVTSAHVPVSAAVRVRPELLDRLVNQAGEVMITRTKMEGELTQLRTSLADLTDNLDRLRHQLRDIELQAESQMQSRLAQAKETHQTFDPLEFDRFTRVQELTRMMAESVNDVATVQRNLQRAVDATEDGLTAQARQTRELQRDLLRTRMVEFEGIADRLYRVVRQASKEEGKQVRLDIVGGSIEMDRGVLDRMTPAFEHLLRNCVVHGIESASEREAAGKPAEGRITVRLAQEGNDVSVSFADDGKGLDVARIAAKAQALGLVDDVSALVPADAAQLIFAPGLTTAAEVTGLAGRGIGMDVVRSEVIGLGGRIDTHTEPGQGTRFDMVLPLTTAVTQVVIVRAGDFSMGVPSGLVEVVRRMTAAELAQAYASGSVTVAGEEVPFYWAGALLQVSRHSDVKQSRTTPVVIFRSAAQRVALHVDEVLGNQEVVVKNLGPQLSRLPGLAATTVLASGAVSLIYNPVALSALYGTQVRAWVAQGEPPTLSDTLPPETVRAQEAVAAQPPLVLVVDDSITVRRVTQRLLVREGYRVALATDGLQALEKLQAERPAVVLSDIEMPRMDGFDLVRNIRSDPRLADLPVIMITSRIAEKHREHAQQLGVDHYLGKPYSEDELLHWIQHYCAERQALNA